MSPKVIRVQALDQHHLRLIFDNNEIRIFDVTPYLSKGIFAELKAIHYFQKVKPFFGGIQWPNEQDFSPDTLYLLSHLEQISDTIVKSNSMNPSPSGVST